MTTRDTDIMRAMLAVVAGIVAIAAAAAGAYGYTLAAFGAGVILIMAGIALACTIGTKSAQSNSTKSKI